MTPSPKPTPQRPQQSISRDRGSGCPCSYCTAIRQGTLPPVGEKPSVWARRMGAK